MKSISELTDFYYNRLYPELKILEEQRKTIKKRVINIGIIYLLFVALISFYLYQNVSFDILSFFLIFALAGTKWLYSYLIRDYSIDFKNKIIAPLITEIDENLQYSPHLHILASDFNNSRLFRTRPDRISGNDYVKGEIDGTAIEFSDLLAEKKHTDSKGRESWERVFLGLFIVSEFPKKFHGQTVVLPDSAQKIFGDLVGGWLQKNNTSRNELVKMDNVEFEKEFVVYSTDQIEARYILTPAMMQKLLHFKKKTKHPIYVSFIGGKIYLAIEYNSDMFEASVFHSLLEYKIAMEYIQTLHLAVGIVEELKLNQKLWSKL
jgi:hypothetical protein